MTSVRESPTVVVVLVNWNSEYDTAECLESLAEQTFDDFCVIVVDNGSERTSIGYLMDRFEWPIYLQNEENQGFTGGNNTGIECALELNPEWLFLLNNDTTIEETLIEELVRAATDLPNKAGIVGPLIHTYETHKIWSAGGKVNPITGQSSHRMGSFEEYSQPERVDYVVGAGMLIQTDVFESIGLLDDDFFLYYEDTEFCYRAREAGWDVWYVPISGIYHKDSIDYVFSRLREYYFTRNRWLFIQKTQPMHRRIVFYFYFLIRWVVLQVIYLLCVNRDPPAARATLKGALHALIGNVGKLGN